MAVSDDDVVGFCARFGVWMAQLVSKIALHASMIALAARNLFFMELRYAGDVRKAFEQDWHVPYWKNATAELSMR